jgi:amino acid transporter
MAFVRSIGRWTLTALVINSVIGSGIFGVPGELTRLLGRASPFAMIFAGLGMAIIMACIAEVASQFSEPGGPYHYVRAAFGRFLGVQVGWFHLLAVVSSVAAAANLFVDYLMTFLPWALTVWERSLLMAIFIAIPAVANYFGVRSGANLSSVMTVAKLSPLALLILFGVARFAQQPQMIHPSEIAAPGMSNWLRAMVFVSFPFLGWEDSLIPTGEVKDPRRTIPFALSTGLLTCAATYALLQFITVATLGTSFTERPLPDAASVLIGRGGAAFVAIAVMVSTYGWISADLLNAPRLAYSLAAEGDFPGLFARLHPRFHAPATAIMLYAVTGWALAVSGTFLWAVALSAGSNMVYYAATSAALIRLRKLRPNADAFRVPFGPALSMVAIGLAMALLTGLKRREALLMCVTTLIATANWAWARRHQFEVESRAKSGGSPSSAL